MTNIYLALTVMALTVYVIRVSPLLFLRKPIRNRWFRSFLYYVPYVTLSVMTFPAILTVTENPLCGLFALIVGVLISWFFGDLFAVSIACCITVFAAQFLL
ncbi:MAG: AzlD domain-containing protein [Lachnospiraceae bacterium]|nr:AzlD domain-containing protein [Lachnospiraceae bacterium]MEE3379360.1 AzlD domain-containing protein [Lachnospiraceae bacterium]MEE3432299.1 AzlD domain-containing protein [Lachnospiraceae bacterium]